MAHSFRDLPIKRKLTLFILLTTSFALLLMGSALITYELITFRRSLATNMGVLAQIIGSNSTAALAFSDPKNAQEILGALAAERQVTGPPFTTGAGASSRGSRHRQASPIFPRNQHATATGSKPRIWSCSSDRRGARGAPAKVQSLLVVELRDSGAQVFRQQRHDVDAAVRERIHTPSNLRLAATFITSVPSS